MAASVRRPVGATPTVAAAADAAVRALIELGRPEMDLRLDEADERRDREELDR